MASIRRKRSPRSLPGRLRAYGVQRMDCCAAACWTTRVDREEVTYRETVYKVDATAIYSSVKLI